MVVKHKSSISSLNGFAKNFSALISVSEIMDPIIIYHTIFDICKDNKMADIFRKMKKKIPKDVRHFVI